MKLLNIELTEHSSLLALSNSLKGLKLFDTEKDAKKSILAGHPDRAFWPSKTVFEGRTTYLLNEIIID